MNIVERPDLSTDYEFAKELLLGMIAMNDPYTVKHSYDVAALAGAIARALKLTDIRRKKLKYAALLHDIGKQAIPKSILSKPSKLNKSEFYLVRTHVNKTKDFLEKVGFDADIIRYISEHHERIDGSGYPNGLKGDEISLEGQIIGLADVLSAMTAPRTYRHVFSITSALKNLQKETPGKFAPELLETALTCLDERIIETVAEF